MKRIVCVLAVVAALVACGRQAPAERDAPGEPVAAAPAQPDGAMARALRTHAGAYYADFARAPGMARFAVAHLGLETQAAARFARDMDVQTPSALIAANGVEALVFFGCMAHNCHAATGVLAIETATGDLFIGVKDEEGETILRPNARLQMLLTQTSPTQSWSDPRRG